MKWFSVAQGVGLTVLLSGCGGLAARAPEPSGVPAVAGNWVTPVPPEQRPAAPPTDCRQMPLGGFADVWRDDQVWPRLGCAMDAAFPVNGTEVYLCDGTHSVWLQERQTFVVIPVYGSGRWSFVPDLSPDQRPMVAPTPSSEPCFPAVGRHGWLAHALHRDAERGLARSGEMIFSGALQAFRGGWLLWNGNVCSVLFADGSWNMF